MGLLLTLHASGSNDDNINVLPAVRLPGEGLPFAFLLQWGSVLTLGLGPAGLCSWLGRDDVILPDRVGTDLAPIAAIYPGDM
jgi:hypothetical protein